MKKIVLMLLIIILISLVFGVYVYAGDMNSLVKAMENTSTMSSASGEEGGGRIGNVINTVIGFLQIAGTGIALIVITILGIKYLLTSPAEKAETKKSILPIIIGCVLLFGAVNLMRALYDFTNKAFS